MKPFFRLGDEPLCYEAPKSGVEVEFEVEGEDTVGEESADEDSDEWKTSNTAFEVIDV